MQSKVIRSPARAPTLTDWEQKKGESDDEYRAFLEFANHPDPAISPVLFCQDKGWSELLPVTISLAWSARKSALIEYQGIVTGLRAKQTVYRLLKDTVERIEKIETDVYGTVEREGTLSDRGGEALKVFFRCAELAARLTNAINEKAMRINVITQVNAQLPVLSREWDDPGETIIDGDG